MFGYICFHSSVTASPGGYGRHESAERKENNNNQNGGKIETNNSKREDMPYVTTARTRLHCLVEELMRPPCNQMDHPAPQIKNHTDLCAIRGM